MSLRTTASAALPPGPRSAVPGGIFVRVRRRGLLPFLQETASRYGDVAFFSSLGQKFCLVSDPALIRDILVTHNARFTKGPALRGAKSTLGEGLLTSEPPFHDRQRRLVTPAFHARRVKDYARTFVRFADDAADRWRSGEAIDIAAEMTELTLRVVAKTLFDAELEEQVRPLGQDMSVIVSMFERARNPLAPLLNRLPLPSNRRFLRALGRLDATIAALIAARRRAPAQQERPDLLSLLLMARDTEGDQGGMTDKQVRDEAVTLFMAGHETTANALVWTWMLLAQNPEAEAALHRELAEVLGKGDTARAPEVEDVERLPYTRAVVAESMRLYPPAWIVARQCADAYELAGYRLPPRTVFLMSQFIVHRDPRWWPQPESFRPERWLSDESGRPRYAYFPFGGGPRSCAGEAFAWLEATLILATLARRWRLRRVDESEVELFPTITLRPKEAVFLVPEARNA